MSGSFAPALDRRGALLALLAAAAVPRAGAAAGADESAAFEARTLAAAFDALGRPLEPDASITLTLPQPVPNGAVVPVTVTSRLPGAQTIYIVVEGNPQPLAARFSIPDGTEAVVSTRIKLARSCTVYAAVMPAAGGGALHVAARSAEVEVGGCE